MEGKVHLGWGQGGPTVRVGTSDALHLPPCQGAKVKGREGKPLPLATVSKLGRGVGESAACWGMCDIQLALSSKKKNDL